MMHSLCFPLYPRHRRSGILWTRIICLKWLKYGGGIGLPALQWPSELTGISSRMGLLSIHIRARTQLTSKFSSLVLVEGQLEGVSIQMAWPFGICTTYSASLWPDFLSFLGPMGTLDNFVLEPWRLPLGNTGHVWGHTSLLVTIAEGQLAFVGRGQWCQMSQKTQSSSPRRPVLLPTWLLNPHPEPFL